MLRPNFVLICNNVDVSVHLKCSFEQYLHHESMNFKIEIKIENKLRRPHGLGAYFKTYNYIYSCLHAYKSTAYAELFLTLAISPFIIISAYRRKK